MRIHTDKRSVEIDFGTEPEKHLEALGKQLRPLRVEVAKTVRAVERAGRHSFHGLARVESLARKRGYGREETWQYRMVGRAMEIIPELEERLLLGRIPFECAAILGDMTRIPECAWELSPAKPGDEEHEALRTQWLERAEKLVPKSLRLLAEKRKEEARMRRRIVTLRLFVTPETVRDLDRCATLCSRKKRRALSRSQAMAVVLKDFLKRHDPMHESRLALDGDGDGEGDRDAGEQTESRTKKDTPPKGRPSTPKEKERAPAPPGKPSRNGKAAKRVSNGSDDETWVPDYAPEAEYDPRKRHIPAKVRRFVRKRADDCCEFPGCPNDIFLNFCHIKAHAKGGSRNARNILLLCSHHHTLFDCQVVKFRGWGRDGPVFKAHWGDIFGEYG